VGVAVDAGSAVTVGAAMGVSVEVVSDASVGMTDDGNCPHTVEGVVVDGSVGWRVGATASGVAVTETGRVAVSVTVV
jgi:hypothetical protein